MAGLRDELKSMAEGFRWGRRPMVPRSAEPYALEREDRTFPTDWARTEAGTAARQVILKAMILPMLRNEVALKVYGRDVLEGVRGAADLLLEPHEPPRRDDHHDVAPGPLAVEDGGGRGARLLLRRVVAAGVHRPRLRRVRDRSGARRSQRRHEGARAARRGLVARRVPGGRRARPTGTCSGSVTARRGSASRPAWARRRSRSGAPTRRGPRARTGRRRAGPP